MNKHQKMCETCKELSEEKNEVSISEIEIAGWYYHWHRPILYCPVCGKRIIHENTSDK